MARSKTTWSKGTAPKGKGRPKGAWSTKDAFRRDAEKRGVENVIERLYQENLPLYMSYWLGKPAEIHEITAEVKHDISPRLIEAASKLAKKLLLP